MELVAVISQRERLLERAGERFEAREMRLPLRAVEVVESDGARSAIVAEPETTHREASGVDRVEEAFAESLDRALGSIRVGHRSPN